MPEIEVRGDVVTRERVARNTRLPPSANVPERGNAPFVAVHHHDWEYVEAGPSVPECGEWLACVTECVMNPGSNGVGITGIGKDARLNPAGLLAGLRQKKSIEIPQHDPRLGEYADYVTKYTLLNGSPYYTYAWLSFVLINGGRNAVPRLDKAAMYGFRRRIVECGLVEAMPRLTLDTHLVRIEGRIARATELRNQGRMVEEAYRKVVGDLEKRRDLMVQAWDRQFGAIAGAPVVVDSSAAPVVEEDPLAWDPDENLPNPAEAQAKARGGRAAKKEA